MTKEVQKTLIKLLDLVHLLETTIDEDGKPAFIQMLCADVCLEAGVLSFEYEQVG